MNSVCMAKGSPFFKSVLGRPCAPHFLFHYLCLFSNTDNKIFFTLRDKSNNKKCLAFLEKYNPKNIFLNFIFQFHCVAGIMRTKRSCEIVLLVPNFPYTVHDSSPGCDEKNQWPGLSFDITFPGRTKL